MGYRHGLPINKKMFMRAFDVLNDYCIPTDDNIHSRMGAKISSWRQTIRKYHVVEGTVKRLGIQRGEELLPLEGDFEEVVTIGDLVLILIQIQVSVVSSSTHVTIMLNTCRCSSWCGKKSVITWQAGASESQRRQYTSEETFIRNLQTSVDKNKNPKETFENGHHLKDTTHRLAKLVCCLPSRFCFYGLYT